MLNILYFYIFIRTHLYIIDITINTRISKDHILITKDILI
jgi:hypothetical protein